MIDGCERCGKKGNYYSFPGEEGFPHFLCKKHALAELLRKSFARLIAMMREDRRRKYD